ncbi:Glutaredoxin [Sorochytrium milnesiophthora]
MSSQVAALIQKLIKDNVVMVFSKSYCPYCNKAKALLRSIGQTFHAIELDQMDNGSEIQNELEQLTKQRTVPNIFIKGQHVGGCSDLVDANQSGQLKKLLA